MNQRYEVPNHLFAQLARVAKNAPNPMYMDAMGHDPNEMTRLWIANLAATVNLIAVEAWAAGAQYVMEQLNRPISIHVTPDGVEKIMKDLEDGQ